MCYFIIVIKQWQNYRTSPNSSAYISIESIPHGSAFISTFL
jgi:hypothetical protein